MRSRTPLCMVARLTAVIALAAGSSVVVASAAGASAAPSGDVKDPRTGITWVRLAGGRFMMGSSTGDPEERPVHRVTVRTFQMAKTEVTVGQYRRCVQAGRCTAPDESDSECNWKKPGREDHPVNCVTWHQARVFAIWAGARLPSEAEWEYAARSGGLLRTWPWGEEWPSCRRAVVRTGQGYGCGQKRTWPVCSRPAGNTAQGLCDVAGNVLEWVQDWFHDRYTGAPVDGSAWETPAGKRRVVRGGSHICLFHEMRTTFRRTGFHGDFIGFRLARSLP